MEHLYIFGESKLKIFKAAVIFKCLWISLEVPELDTREVSAIKH